MISLTDVLTRGRYTREIPGEGVLTVVEGSLRGPDYPTPEEELDDYAELFDGGDA